LKQKLTDNKETTMYHLDPNINTAIERQADRLQAVRAFRLNSSSQQAAPSWTNGQSQTSWITAKATLALAAAAPIILALVWALAAR
jgi:hypothetical protein